MTVPNQADRRVAWHAARELSKRGESDGAIAVLRPWRIYDSHCAEQLADLLAARGQIREALTEVRRHEDIKCRRIVEMMCRWLDAYGDAKTIDDLW